ncbi:MAG: hypothetical protein J6T73_03030 [Clostridia bacterium]|nr:hypothetical protein [Clostridia bacterium]
MKRTVCFLLLITTIVTLSACVAGGVKGSVVRVSDSGDAELDIMPQKLLEQIDIGSTVIVSIGKFEKEMPFVDEILTEDEKLQLYFDKEDWGLRICIFNNNFCEKYDIDAGDKVVIGKK